MKPWVAALAAGALFGIGLALSGMTQPEKVIGFLDVGGTWDPSLAFVMAGALLVHTLLARRILRRTRPMLDDAFHLPKTGALDAKLVAGAGIFGIGWGLGGFCPGPAIVSAGCGTLTPLVFVGAMAIGMTIHHFLPAKR